MTKAQEIEALRGFAASLPQDTYVAEWLRYIIPSVERDITSDIMPDEGTSIAAMIEQEREAMKASMSKALGDHARVMAQAQRDTDQRERFIDEAAHNLRLALHTIRRS